MSRRDQLDELDQKIAATFQSAAEELRQELGERLRETRDQLHRLVQQAAREAAPEPGSTVASGDLCELRQATATLVSAATQNEVLECLVQGATRFSSRAAFFLVDDRAARLWAGRGFAGVGDGLTVPVEGNRPWERLVIEQGTLRLSSEDCREALGGSHEAKAPASGVLVPMSLADRLAGALYADDLQAEVELAPEPLQLLVQSASACLESLSLRPRRLPISLRLAGKPGGSTARLELWSAAADGDPREEE